MDKRRRVAFIGAAVGLTVALFAPQVAANPNATVGQTAALRKAVTLDGIREHQAAFQAHSDANGGNRVGGSDGYDASADYVIQKLEAAGYEPVEFEFEFLFNADRTPPVFRQVSPNPTTYVDGPDFASMTFSPNGDTTAQVWAVDLVLPVAPGPGATTSGCEASDFAGFPAGAIALVQRGTCPFAAKGQNASAAGASAVIVMNDGGDAGRFSAINGTLGSPAGQSVPVIGTSNGIGNDLADTISNGDTGSVARVRVDRLNEPRITRNILADTSGGDPDNVVVVGAHLDSVPRGPGVQDNGSGSAAILEIAEELATRQSGLKNKVRFAWWGAEEFGLLGSAAYVNSLSPSELATIKLNLNFDMIGSPNFVRFIYDGDNSAFPAGPNAQDGPDGSGAIESIFAGYFDSQGLAHEPTPFNGRSDYGPFIAKGIPAGGLFTGAEGAKTLAQAAIFGGTAGQQYDPCYHLACDTYDNVSLTALDQMSDAAAHATLHFAMRRFDKYPLIDGAPSGGGGGGGGGGGLHDDDHEVVAE